MQRALALRGQKSAGGGRSWISTHRVCRWHLSTRAAATPLALLLRTGAASRSTNRSETKRVPVTQQGTRASHPPRRDPIFMVWDGGQEIATIEGVLEGHWEGLGDA